MRAVVVVVLFAFAVLPGCQCSGPAVTPGVGEGADCGSSLDCATGLICECAVCVADHADPRPPVCEGVAPTGCPLTPTACVTSCNDGEFTGDAACVDGDEVCAVGVLQSTCACPAEIPGGWFCEDGALRCFSRADDGLCRTTNCPARTCVSDCADATPETAECVDDVPGGDGVLRCAEASDIFFEDSCELCQSPPFCLNGCDPNDASGTADCDAFGNFSCAVGIPATDCLCEPAFPPTCLVGCDPLVTAGLSTCDLVSNLWTCTSGTPADQCGGEGEGEGEVVGEGEGEVVGEGEGEGEAPCPGAATCDELARVPCLRSCDPLDAPLRCQAQCRSADDTGVCTAAGEDGCRWSCRGFTDYVPADQCP